MTRFPEALLRSDVIGPLFVTPVALMTMLASIGLVLWFRARSERARHAMLQFLVEKGHPVPPDLFATKARPASDLRRGITLVGLGVGLGLALLIAREAEASGFALIPTLMGVGYLVVWRINGGPREGGAGRV
jgi:hypothetical protein